MGERFACCDLHIVLEGDDSSVNKSFMQMSYKGSPRISSTEAQENTVAERGRRRRHLL